ncbi:MAG: MATE family efflux transporter [Lachnospiraceae bacterium]|nr:MATE family efflux transporter [Lachnospiraceae bacterium]
MMKTGTNKVVKALLTLAWPAILEGMFQTLLQYIDTAMVGRLGAAATATVSLSSTYSWLINSVISGLSIGFLSYIARGIGQGDDKKVQEAARQTILVALVVGIAIMGITLWMAPHMPVWMGAESSIHRDATRYFVYVNLPMVFRAATIIFGAAIRATGDTKTPMYVNVFVSFLNIGLNYLFIYQLSQGAVGAGMATAISVVIGGAMMTMVFLHNPVLRGKETRVPLAYYRPDGRVFAAIMAIGFPIVLTRVASCLGHVVFTSFVSSMSTTIYAAHAIAITAEEIFYIPGYGMMAATSTMIGNAIGEGNPKKERDVKLASISIIFLLMCVSGFLLFVGAEFMMGIFTEDEQVIAIGAKLLRMVAFTEPIFGTSAVMEGIYNGMGRTRYPLLVELVSMWGVRIVGAFICVRYLGMGITAVWIMMIANNVLKAVMLAVGLKRVNIPKNLPI